MEQYSKLYVQQLKQWIIHTKKRFKVNNSYQTDSRKFTEIFQQESYSMVTSRKEQKKITTILPKINNNIIRQHNNHIILNFTITTQQIQKTNKQFNPVILQTMISNNKYSNRKDINSTSIKNYKRPFEFIHKYFGHERIKFYRDYI